MIFRVLDIETVPDLSFWKPGEPKWSWERPRDSMRDRFSPDEMDLVAEHPFPPPHAQRVVSISWVDVALDVRGTPRYRLAGMHKSCLWSAPRDEVEDRRLETRLLREFGEAATAARADGGLCLVTWNGRTFDLPVIALRSLRLGVPCPWYYEDRDVRYRYSAEGHLDLMDFLSDFGAARNMRLNDVARMIGLPGKTDMSGAQVSGDYEKTLERDAGQVFADVVRSNVARYCLQDSLQTAIIFLRTRYHLGKITGEAYHECLSTFEQSEDVNTLVKINWPALRVDLSSAGESSVGEVRG